MAYVGISAHRRCPLRIGGAKLRKCGALKFMDEVSEPQPLPVPICARAWCPAPVLRVESGHPTRWRVSPKTTATASHRWCPMFWPRAMARLWADFKPRYRNALLWNVILNDLTPLWTPMCDPFCDAGPRHCARLRAHGAGGSVGGVGGLAEPLCVCPVMRYGGNLAKGKP